MQKPYSASQNQNFELLYVKFCQKIKISKNSVKGRPWARGSSVRW